MRSAATEEWIDGYVALTEGCGLVADASVDEIAVQGKDARRFINGLVTCDVRELSEGAYVYGFVTNAQGRVLADVVITAAEPGFVLEVPAGRGKAIDDHLLKYRVADRVDTTLSEARPRLLAAGPRAESVLSEVLGSTAAACGRVGDVTYRPERRLGVDGRSLGGEARQLSALRRRLETRGAYGATPEAVEAVRIERGVAWYGVDFGEENFPQETGLEEWAVSYDKGCYLGQEIVARIHYRGHVNRYVRGLIGAESVELEAGREVLFDGEKVGSVSSASWSPAVDAPIALAMLHRKAAVGSTVTLDGNVALEVVELPFVAVAEGR